MSRNADVKLTTRERAGWGSEILDKPANRGGVADHFSRVDEISEASNG